MAQLVLRDFIYKFANEDSLNQFLNEFSFIEKLSSKWRSQGCLCGMADDIKISNNLFNELINSMIDKKNQLLYDKIKFSFSLNEIEFGLQENGKFIIKKYE